MQLNKGRANALLLERFGKPNCQDQANWRMRMKK